MSKSALDGKRMNAFRYDPDELVIVGVDTEDGPDHPLYDLTERHEIDEGMVLNIMELGVLEPALVCKVGDASERGYFVAVVDGRRRVLHARAAKKKMEALGEPGSVTVPVVLQKGGDSLLERVSMAANFVREDDTTLGKAERVAKLLRRNGGDYEEAAIAIGATVKTVQTYEKLMELAAKVRNAVNDGKLSATAAVKLHGLAKADQEAQLAKLLEASGGKKVTTRETKAAANGANGKHTPIAPKKRVLKKLIASWDENEESADGLTDEFMLGVKYALGMAGPKEVDGLQAALDALE